MWIVKNSLRATLAFRGLGVSIPAGAEFDLDAIGRDTAEQSPQVVVALEEGYLQNVFKAAREATEPLLPEWTEDSFPGFLLNVAAGRVANRFDLGGSNYTVDAACGSSLAAAAAAVRELETGAADMVILGGVDTVQNPFTYLAFSKTLALSPRGRCRPFDASADGIVISEGVAAMVLKRRADAERVVREFLPRAFRRPVTEAEVEHYLRIYDGAADAGEAARIRFFPCDMRRGDLPPAADLVAFKSVLHDWPDGDAEKLLARAHTLVRPGGRLLIFERAPIELNGRRPSYAMAPDLVLLHFLRPADLYVKTLAALGFVGIEHRRIALDIGFHLIVARRPA